MTYPEAIEYLYSLQIFGIKLGLENVEHLLARVGNPHRSLRFIHIAGTNGKGSVAAMLASICQSAGLRTGLYTSPHLVSFCERIQVHRETIAEEDVVRWVERLRPEVEAMGRESEARHPTFFEVVTAMALLHFQRERADIVIWETGMGGRLDATNVVTPLVSVITNIHWDHQAYLGNTLEDIAREKAGIIKPRVPVVSATGEIEAAEVIEETCEQLQAPLIRVGHEVHVRQVSEDLHSQHIVLHGYRHDHGELDLPLLGSHQAINAATAVAAIEAACPDISTDHVREGLRRTRWAGRFQLVESAHPPVLLDGAHNIASAVALKATLCRHFAGRRIILVLGILADKNFAVMCAELAPLAEAILLVRVKNARTAQPDELARVCRGINPRAIIECAPAFSSAQDRARQLAGHDPRSLIVVTGSLFLVGEAMESVASPARAAGLRKSELTFQ